MYMYSVKSVLVAVYKYKGPINSKRKRILNGYDLAGMISQFISENPRSNIIHGMKLPGENISTQYVWELLVTES